MFLSSDLAYLRPSRLTCSCAIANHAFLQETEVEVELNTSWQKQLLQANYLIMTFSTSLTPLKKGLLIPSGGSFVFFVAVSCYNIFLMKIHGPEAAYRSLMSHQRFPFLNFQLMDSCCQQSCKISYLTFYAFIIIQVLRIIYFFLFMMICFNDDFQQMLSKTLEDLQCPSTKT